MKVAPLVGAWIETASQPAGSHQRNVAPLVGAWIETYDANNNSRSPEVAPLVGAWIETASRTGSAGPQTGRPSRRGVD